jgi:phenylpyruvate tautomerase PptA (4-oxalocrotonate tautomerase family)
MPLITVSVVGKRDAPYKRALLDSIQQALVASGVPATDRFQRVLELDRDSFVFDPRYPDLETARDDDFVLVEVLWSVGRSVKIKRKVALDIATGVARSVQIDAERVMVVFVETQWENWAFGGGRLLHG